MVFRWHDVFVAWRLFTCFINESFATTWSVCVWPWRVFYVSNMTTTLPADFESTYFIRFTWLTNGRLIIIIIRNSMSNLYLHCSIELLKLLGRDSVFMCIVHWFLPYLSRVYSKTWKIISEDEQMSLK